MKKVILFTAILLMACVFMDGYPQGIPTYPIPSYNITVDGYANFRENYHSVNLKQTKEKREVNVHVKSVFGSQGCQATVWVYSLDQTTILGPYTVNCDETLVVQIDERDWGVLVESEEEITVDVWFNQP